MRILHTYCLNYNLGDHLLGIGVKNLLRHFLPVSSIGETNLQGQVFDEYFIEQVLNRRFDLLVIGGGGIVHGSHWPNGWFWLIPQELVSRIQIPFVVYGIGNNYFPSEEALPERGAEHLRETLRHAKHFSVRNDGSRGRLQEALKAHLDEVPDPGFHVRIDTGGQESPSNYVVIQIAADKWLNRVGNEESGRRLVQALTRISEHLSRDFRVIFAPHVLDDMPLSEDLARNTPGATVWDFARMAFDRSSEAIEVYAKAHFVLAMRGHGQIVPLSLGVPVLALSTHPKHGGLMDALGLGGFVVNASDSHLGDALFVATNATLDSLDAYRSSLPAMNAQLWEQTSSAWHEISKRLG